MLRRQHSDRHARFTPKRSAEFAVSDIEAIGTPFRFGRYARCNAGQQQRGARKYPGRRVITVYRSSRYRATGTRVTDAVRPDHHAHR